MRQNKVSSHKIVYGVAGVAFVFAAGLFYSSHKITTAELPDSSVFNRSSYEIIPGDYQLKKVETELYSNLNISKQDNNFQYTASGPNLPPKTLLVTDMYEILTDFDGCKYVSSTGNYAGIPIVGAKNLSEYKSTYLEYNQLCPGENPKKVMVRTFALPVEVNVEYAIHTYSAEVYSAESGRTKSFYLNLFYSTKTKKHIETGFSMYNYLQDTRFSVRF